jgi:hypothetical protein
LDVSIRYNFGIMLTNKKNFRVCGCCYIIILITLLYGCGVSYTNPTSPTNTAIPEDGEADIAAAMAQPATTTPSVELSTKTPEAPTFTPPAPGIVEEIIDPTPTAELIFTHTPNPYVTATPQASDIQHENINPLTGLFVDDSAVLDRSPVLVKISNFPREIRPQSGLSKADIVFEYYIGGFMNRFLAVYYGQNAEWAGPIRSGRLIDAQLAKNYQGMLVYGGADERVNAVITAEEFLGNRAIDTRYFSSCPPICGTDTHSLEGVYVDTAMMSEWAFMMERDQHQRPNGLNALIHTVDLPPITNLVAATEIEIITSVICRSKWLYDPLTVSYLRWEESEDRSDNYVPSIDVSANLLQVDTQNVLILYANYVVYDAMLHDIRIHYADDVMPAIFFRDGYQFRGYWSGLDPAIPLQFYDADFSPFALAPGKAWVVFVTPDSEINPSGAPGSWQVNFARP